MVLGVALASTGGGEFFLKLALSLLGRKRGGAAKVSIMASALFGSFSGSLISNVITTGTITIPAMIKTGFTAVRLGFVKSLAPFLFVINPALILSDNRIRP